MICLGWSNLDTFCKELYAFFFSSTQPTYYKLEVLVFSSFFFSTLIFLINYFIVKIRAKGVIQLPDISFKIYVFWVLGSIFVTILLYFFNVIDYKLTAFIIVAFVWEKLFERAYNTTNNDKSGLKGLKEEFTVDDPNGPAAV